jgi:subtilisin family serine protease
MKSKFLVRFAVLCLVFLTIGMQQGQEVRRVEPQSSPPAMETGEMTNETPLYWFVELPSPPLADGGDLAVLNQEKGKFRTQAKGLGLRYQERFSFDNLWNGLSIQIEQEDLARLNLIPGIKNIYPVVSIPIPAEPPAEDVIELITALAMTGADIVQSELGYTGRGVRVGIIDTGIDYDHPDLGGDGTQRSNSWNFPTARVVAGWDFVGDNFGTTGIPVPDPYPDDCYGHGTHVAGIVGANGAIKGVAPEVTFGAYRVFGCVGSTYSDIMIAAMERALYDGMDIVSMSIGNRCQWPEYPTAAASDRLVNKGVVVVAAAGNDAGYGLYGSSAPGLGDKVISVASFDNTYQNLSAFTVSPDNTPIGYISASGAPPAPVSGTFPMARTGTPSSTADACSALPAGSLAGKIALIRRGTCTFYAKAINAMNAGAVGVVLYNNTTGYVSPTVAGTPPVTIPVVAITAADGVLINNRLAAGPVNLTWTNQAVSIPNPTGNLISSFSSYGLSPDLAVKPDIGAPGGIIRSTYPIELGSYTIMSGTSMATPHVAGAAALYLQAHPHTPSQIMRTVLQNSAEPHLWWGNPALGYLDNVHRQGAGMLRIDSAILATTKIEPGKISAGEGQAGPFVQTLTVENNSEMAVTYNLSYVNALSTGGVITPSFYLSDASVSFSSPTVMVPAKGEGTVKATIIPATGPQFGQYGGYIIFTPQGGGQIFRVPFAGFVGDYQSIVVLQPTSYGFPWLAKWTGSAYAKQSAGATFTLSLGDFPYILFHLEHQARILRFEVFSTTGKAWHRAYEQWYVPRSSTPTSYFGIGWAGQTYGGSKIYTVPDGQYVIKVSVLKALGDSNNPADWETWTSPAFIIDRP